MHTMRSFFKTLFFSLNPFYYAEIVQKPLSFSYAYYFLFQIFFAAGATTYVVIRFFLPFEDLVDHLPDHIVRIYPDHLIIAISNGQVSTNVDEPYMIPFSTVNPLVSQFEKTSTVSGRGAFENFMTIDTYAGTEDLDRYQTWSLLTWDSFLYIYNGHVETVPLNTVEKLTINEETVRSISSQIEPFTDHMIFILSLLSFMSFFVAGIIRLLFALIVSFFLFPLMRILKLHLSWSKSFQIVLHTSPLIQTVLAIASLVGIHSRFPFMSILLNLAAGIVVVLSIKKLTRINTKSPS